MSNFQDVKTFMKTFGQEVKNKPELSTEKINLLRISLIKEELEELQEAIKQEDGKIAFIVYKTGGSNAGSSGEKIAEVIQE